MLLEKHHHHKQYSIKEWGVLPSLCLFSSSLPSKRMPGEEDSEVVVFFFFFIIRNQPWYWLENIMFIITLSYIVVILQNVQVLSYTWFSFVTFITQVNMAGLTIIRLLKQRYKITVSKIIQSINGRVRTETLASYCPYSLHIFKIIFSSGLLSMLSTDFI